MAATALFCELSAKASCSSREMPWSSTWFSAVQPIASSGNIASIFLFGKRQPSEVSKPVMLPALGATVPRAKT